MANKSITSLNSVFMLAIVGLYDVPIKIQGFATDDAFSTEAVQTAEVVIGVDGHLSAGYVPALRKMTIVLQADSESNAVFDAWQAAMDGTREVYFATGTISMPSISQVYTLTKGALTSFTPVPGVKKTLEPRRFEISWERVYAAPITE